MEVLYRNFENSSAYCFNKEKDEKERTALLEEDVSSDKL
jgi:hypothetical protein